MRAFWAIVGAAAILLIGFFGFKALNKPSSESISSTLPAQEFADFNKLESEKYKIAGQSELDVDQLIKLIPENVAVTYASSTFDADTGATTVTDLKITMANNSDAGMRVEKLLLWGVDEKAISDRAMGLRLNETIPVASRIEADNISLFGFESIFDDMMNAANDMSIGIAENMIGDGDVDVDWSTAMPEQSFDKFAFNVRRTIVTDISVHPWGLKLTDLAPLNESKPDEVKDKQFNDLWHIVQKFAAWNHALSYKNYASYDVDFDMHFTQDKLPMAMEMSYELMGYRDIYRGDTGYGIIKGSRSQSDMTIPVHQTDDDNPNVAPMKSESFTEFYTVENIKISPLLAHLARGEFPGRDKVDLLSLGVLNSGPSWSKINDIKLFSVDSAYFDGSQVHWLIPEIIDIRVKNMKINIGGFIEYMQTSIGMADEELILTEAQKQTFNDSIKILKKYDLSEPVMDFAMALHWDANSGAADMGYTLDVEDFIRYEVKTDAIIPDYNTLMAAIPAEFETMDSKAFGQTFAEHSAFKKYNLVITDKGGLDKGFAMAVDFAQLMPEDDPQTAMLRSTTPEILRNMAVNAFVLPMSEVGKVFPPGVRYLQSMSDFVADGGSLGITIAPTSPVYARDFEALVQKFQGKPDEIEDTLGIQVVHTSAQ